MELKNQTKLCAEIIRGTVPCSSQIAAVVVAKATATRAGNNQLQIDLNTNTPVLREPKQLGEYEIIPADVGIKKEGVDVMAIGDAHHPAPEGGEYCEVSVQVNDERRHLAVFGDRFWTKSAGGWTISKPRPFTVIPMTWRRSFGGVSRDDYHNELPYALNVDGMGFIGDESDIDDKRLPNIEDPDHLISSWEDQPKPCNICPAPKQLSFDVEKYSDQLQKVPQETFKLPDSFWNNAIRKFRFPTLQPGDKVVLSGMSDQPISLIVPDLRLQVETFIGQKSGAIPLVLDTLMFLPNKSRCLLTWRAGFVYELRPRELRQAVLTQLS